MSNQAPEAATSSTERGATFRIATMDCAGEEAEIRAALEPITEIASLRFQLGARMLTITAPEPAVVRAEAAIRSAGFDPKRVDVVAEARAVATGEGPANSPGTLGSGIGRLVLALVFALGAEGLSFAGGESTLLKGIEITLSLAAIALAGLDTYKKGVTAVLHLKLNINALMSVAVTGAFLIRQWPEAAMVMALYAIAELIEAGSVDRARNAIQGLLALAPDVADVRQPDGTWASHQVKDVAIDAVVRIRPGERVPLDGIVTTGTSAINQAPVTGESLPVDKAVGDQVFAGTVNETGELSFRVTSAASNTTLARIIHAVEEAQGTRAPTQRFVDKFAAIYTPCVFVLALAVAVSTPFLLHWTWSQSVYKALVLLVIACPCALVISTPVTVVSALASAARRGILIKGGTYLEEARKLKVIALDKTGTVTLGKPKLVAWNALAVDEPTLGPIALAMASRSDHPVSKAIADGLRSADASHAAGAADADVGELRALPGRGISARYRGTTYVLGNHRLIEERKQCSRELEAALGEHEAAGRTVTLLASDDGVLALFAVADTIKETSRAAIAELKEMGIVCVMLTGDNPATAKTIAAEAGIDEARGDLLPEHKLDAIKDLQRQHGVAGMTGDGINDAPALAQADIGFAMGGAGTDTAMEAADVVVMNDDLRRIPETIRLSRRTHAILWQNISLALGIKGVFFVLAVFGTATMWMAVFADMGASLLVVANGLRLLRLEGLPQAERRADMPA